MELDIDFKILEDDSFKEDSVREEIIAPILRYLGYRPDKDPKIVRSKSLTHQYVMFGSSMKKITLIPGYTLYRNGKPRIVIDAKAPKQNIISGDNVSQVFSYAIHPEIRTSVYGLCNGYQLTLFHIFSTEPVKVYDLTNMTKLDWEDLKQKVSEIEIERIEAFGFLLDYGMCFEHLGFDMTTPQLFIGLPVGGIGKISDNKYTLNIKVYFLQDREVLMTADITAEHLNFFLREMTPECRNSCIYGLSHQPFFIDTTKLGFEATFHGRLSENIVESRNGEKFRPIIVEKVFTKEIIAHQEN